MPPNVSFQQLNIGMAVKVNPGGVQNVQNITNSIINLGNTAQKTGKQVASSFQKMAGAYTSLFVARRVAGAVGSILKPAMDLETATSQLSISTRATGAQLDMLVDASVKAAAATSFSPTESIAGMERLALVIRDTKGAADAILPTLALAQTYFGKNVPVAVGHATSLAKAFNLQGNEVAKTFNQWVAIASTAGVRVDELGVGFKKLGAAGTLANKGFLEMGPLLALAVKAGVPAREASTGLFMAMQNLARPEARNEIKNTFGIITSEAGKMQDPRAILLELAESIDTLGGVADIHKDALRKAFGARALFPILGILRLINSGIEVQGKGLVKGAALFELFTKNVQDGGDILTEMSKMAMEPLAARFNQLSENVNTFLARALLPFGQQLKGSVTAISEWLQGMTEAMAKNTALGQTIHFVVGLLQRLFIVIGSSYAGVIAWVGGAALFARTISFAKNALTFFTFSAARAAFATAQFNLTTAFASASLGVAAPMSYRFAAGLRAIGFGLKGIVATAFPVLMVLLALYEAWDAFGPKIKEMLGISSSKAAKDKNDLISVGQQQMASMAEANDAALQLAESTQEFDKSVKDWKDVIKESTPEPSGDVFKQTLDFIDKIGKSPSGAGFKGVDIEKMKTDMQKVMEIDKKRQEVLTTGKMPTAAEIKEQQEIFARVSTAIRPFADAVGDQKLLEGITSTGTALKDSVENRKEAASALEYYNYMEGNLAATRLLNSTAEIEQQGKLIGLTANKIEQDTRQIKVLEEQIKKQKEYLELVGKEVTKREEAGKPSILTSLIENPLALKGRATQIRQAERIKKQGELFEWKDTQERAQNALKAAQAKKEQLEQSVKQDKNALSTAIKTKGEATAVAERSKKILIRRTEEGETRGGYGAFPFYTQSLIETGETPENAVKLASTMAEKNPYPMPGAKPNGPSKSTGGGTRVEARQTSNGLQVSVYNNNQISLGEGESIVKRTISKTRLEHPAPARP